MSVFNDLMSSSTRLRATWVFLACSMLGACASPDEEPDALQLTPRDLANCTVSTTGDWGADGEEDWTVVQTYDGEGRLVRELADVFDVWSSVEEVTFVDAGCPVASSHETREGDTITAEIGTTMCDHNNDAVDEEVVTTAYSPSFGEFYAAIVETTWDRTYDDARLTSSMDVEVYLDGVLDRVYDQQFEYDGAGRLTRQFWTSGDSGTFRWNYVWDGDDPVSLEGFYPDMSTYESTYWDYDEHGRYTTIDVLDPDGVHTVTDWSWEPERWLETGATRDLDGERVLERVIDCDESGQRCTLSDDGASDGSLRMDGVPNETWVMEWACP